MINKTLFFLPSSSATRRAQKRVTTFLRQGGRSRIERSIRALWLNQRNRQKGQSVQQAQFRNSLGTGLFSAIPLALSPFVALKTRRRGGRVTLKVAHISQSRGDRKSCRSLANALREKGAVSQPLARRLRRQLEALTPSTRQSPTSSSSNAIQTQKEARDSIHRQALRALPPSWRLLNLLRFFCLLFAIFRRLIPV